MQPEIREVRVFDPDTARLLAVGQECRESRGPGPHTFACDRGNGTLLTFYFGKGKRSVVVRTGPNEGVSARLGTRWKNGHREWTLNW